MNGEGGRKNDVAMKSHFPKGVVAAQKCFLRIKKFREAF